jgi:hypothetical protein
MDSASIYGELVNFDKTAQNPLDIYNQALNKLGISDARTRVTTLRGSLLDTENMLKAVEGDVSARTSEGNVSEAQRRRLVSTNQAPISATLDTIGRNYESAVQGVGDIERSGKTQADLTYEHQKNKRASIAERYGIAKKNEQDAEDRRRWEASQAEQKRQFNEQQALARQNSARGVAADNVTPTEAAMGYIQSARGRDGYVSPSTFNLARKAYVTAGGSASAFAKEFWSFTGISQGKNKNWKDYYYS